MALHSHIWMDKPYSKKPLLNFRKLYKKHWQKIISNRPTLIYLSLIKPTYGLLNLYRRRWGWVTIRFLTIFKNMVILPQRLFLLHYAKRGKREKSKMVILSA